MTVAAAVAQSLSRTGMTTGTVPRASAWSSTARKSELKVPSPML